MSRRASFRFPMIRLVALAACFVASAGPIARAAFAGGECVPITLDNGVPSFVNDDPATFQVSSPESRWAAVAMRHQDGNDWNLEVRTQSEPYPVCTSNPIAFASSFGPDVFAIDGRVGSPGSDYVIARTGSGSGFFAHIEYEQPAAALPTNSVYQDVATGPADFLAVREVAMFAGVSYRIRIQPSSNLGAMRVYVFAPTSTGPGWVPGNQAVLEAMLGPDLLNELDYTPSENGPHALVIVNESGATGTYQLAVGHCPFFVNPMSEGVPRSFATLDDWPGYTPNAHSWPVVGVRGSGYLYDFDVAPHPRLQDGPFPACSDSIVGSQTSGLGTRVVIGDFRAQPLRPYTAHASLAGPPQTSSAGHIEWDGAGDALTVNGAPLAVVPPANNVLDAWKIDLVAGVTYTFTLVPAGGATAQYRLLLFGNASPGVPYWASRPGAILEASGPHGFIPGHTGTYGVVVVNDNGGTGNYTVAVTANLVAVPGGPPAAAAHRIRTTAPNPAAGAMRIEFELARAGTAEFRVRDVAGRTVATIPAGQRDAGIAHATLGGSVPPGVYFLSLIVDGVEAGRARIVLLR